MGATLLNRCKIGNECIVGANALVTEGKEFPDGSMIVGAPARAIRQLSEAERAMVKLSAHHYVLNHQRFRAELKAI
jgi:carbonic anhydrase/acetyltransferase-like protein (isoleucine patch superfamily)